MSKCNFWGLGMALANTDKWHHVMLLDWTHWLKSSLPSWNIWSQKRIWKQMETISVNYSKHRCYTHSPIDVLPTGPGWAGSLARQGEVWFGQICPRYTLGNEQNNGKSPLFKGKSTINVPNSIATKDYLVYDGVLLPGCWLYIVITCCARMHPKQTSRRTDRFGCWALHQLSQRGDPPNT